MCRSKRLTFPVLVEGGLGGGIGGGGLGVLPQEKKSMKGMKWWLLVQFGTDFNTNSKTCNEKDIN